MDYHKDNKKTDIFNSSYRNNNPPISSNKSLINKPIYDYVNKKTEKLITALYMVTDCMDYEDALRGKIRLLGVELLSDMYKLPNLSPVDKRDYTRVVLSHIGEIISLIEISSTIGLISEMNTGILRGELVGLVSKVEFNQSKDKHFPFILDDKMFNLETLGNNNPYNDLNYIKDKRTNNVNMSFMSDTRFPRRSLIQKDNKYGDLNKQDRVEKIMSIIKDRKNIPGNEHGISIKDISSAFVDCSEKTIQRELNSMVLKGQIKKSGSKRWSRYITQ